MAYNIQKIFPERLKGVTCPYPASYNKSYITYTKKENNVYDLVYIKV